MPFEEFFITLRIQMGNRAVGREIINQFPAKNDKDDGYYLTIKTIF